MTFDFSRLPGFADLRAKVGTAPVLLALAALALLAATWIPGAILDRPSPEPSYTQQANGTAAPASNGVAVARPAERADPFEGPGAAVDITLKLLAVLALVYVALAALRRYSLGAGLGRSARAIQVVECNNLAPNRSLYVVNVEGRRLLIGVTASSMSTLAELEEPAEQAKPT
jgi:flagellar biosynthetic protein FliO